MSQAPSGFEVIFPPVGCLFELIHRCRTVAFREGLFDCLAVSGGSMWAVGVRGELSPVHASPSQWQMIDLRCHEVSLLHC